MRRLFLFPIMLIGASYCDSAGLGRTWTSADGRFTTEAEFVGGAEDTAFLRRPDGTGVVVPLAALSQSDRDFIRETLERRGQIRGLLEQARIAIQQRQPSSAIDFFAQADAAAVTDGERHLVARAKQSVSDIANFWDWFAAGCQQLVVGENLTVGSDRATVLANDEHSLLVRTSKGAFRFDPAAPVTAPAELAVAIAKRAAPASDLGLRCMKAFLNLDDRQSDTVRWTAAALTADQVAGLVPEPPAPAATNSKLLPPEASAQREALAAVRRSFQDAYAHAVTPNDRFELARSLYSSAQEMIEAEPSTAFVLYEEAARMAAEVGDAQTAAAIIQSLEQRYAIDDGVERKVALADKALEAIKSQEAARRFVGLCLQLSDEAVAADEYPAAKKLTELAMTAARMTKEPAVPTIVADQIERIERSRAAFSEVKAALTQLEEQPNDPEANLEVGGYYCFSKGDWDGGLEHLARGSRLEIAEIAKEDLAKPSIGEQQEQLAAHWWAHAQTEAENSRRFAMQTRARFWYEQAANNLTGAAQLNAKGRLDEVRRGIDYRAAIWSTALTDMPLESAEGVLLADGETLHRPVRVGGVRYEQGIWAQPSQAQGASHLTFGLGKNFAVLSGTVGFSDDAPQSPDIPTAVIFQITAHDRILWRSEPLIPGQTQLFRVKLSQCSSVHLIAVCNGNHLNAQPVWANLTLAN